jgi:ABC-type sugar transport system substrate-binding protein
MKACGKTWVGLVTMFASVMALSTPAAAQQQKPNIVVIMADDQQFPPRQKPGSFSVEQAMEKLRNPPSSN